MDLNGLWPEDGEYVECIGGPTMSPLPDRRADGEMIGNQVHVIAPASGYLNE